MSSSEDAAVAHRITVTDPVVTVEVVLDGVVVARSDRARVLREGSLPPRFYLPRDDVRMDLLSATEHTTTCPFKGDASYWSVQLDDARHENIAWSYQSPIPEMATIAGLLAFYDERVTLRVDGELPD
jgi:uncharacterized protein (DUF427 family)